MSILGRCPCPYSISSCTDRLGASVNFGRVVQGRTGPGSTSPFRPSLLAATNPRKSARMISSGVRASTSHQTSSSSSSSSGARRTCRNCKRLFEPSQNNPRACRFHTAHFGGETKRKFEGVHTGGTMDTVGAGEILQYWHCCGSTDPEDAGCEAAPHATYDD